MNKKINKKENSNIKIIPTEFRKDNGMIVSRSKMTIFGRKIYDAAAIFAKEYVDQNGAHVLRSELNVTDLKSILGCETDLSVYSRLKKLIKPKPQTGKGSQAPSLLDWKIITVDDKSQYISGINIITDVKYSNGHLSITWNPLLRDKLIDLKKNYTVLDKRILSLFSSNYSYLTYQLLKKTIDYEIWEAKTKHGITLNKTDHFELKMDLVDLKLFYGCVDASVDDELYAAAIDENRATYNSLADLRDRSLAKNLAEYKDWRQYSLERAKNDINTLSDIEMDYKPISNGRGGKAKGVTFTMWYKTQAIESNTECADGNGIPDINESPEIDIFDFIDQLRVFMKHDDFTVRNLRSIAEAANFNIEKIKTAHDIFLTSSNVDNPTGFIIHLIKSNAVPPKPKKASSDKRYIQPPFNFEQRDDDLDTLVQKKIEQRHTQFLVQKKIEQRYTQLELPLDELEC